MPTFRLSRPLAVPVEWAAACGPLNKLRLADDPGSSQAIRPQVTTIQVEKARDGNSHVRAKMADLRF
jgi:hypothetical protein